MSRSYRKPYAAMTGAGSASIDKRYAARGVRRKQNAWLCNHWEDEDFLLPHRYECHHNDVWSWHRDGKQHLQVPDARDWSRYCAMVNGLHPYEETWWRKDEVWPPSWYQTLARK